MLVTIFADCDHAMDILLVVVIKEQSFKFPDYGAFYPPFRPSNELTHSKARVTHFSINIFFTLDPLESSLFSIHFQILASSFIIR